jgi:arylsulfatase A-like enzyme
MGGQPDGGVSQRRAPNMIVILADDLGYGDVCGYSCNGLSTPHIDSIARNGIRCTDGHVTAPICSPSRAGLVTGRYQQRFGHEFNAGGAKRCEEEGLGLPTDETTIADLMGSAGYATGMVGKSHLGSQPQFMPTNRGFDEFFGFLHGANLYIEPREGPGIHYVKASEENFPKTRSPYHPIYRGTEKVEEEQYLTDAFTREAVAFIERHQHEPFFLYVPYSAPHTPLQVTSEYYERFGHIADERRRIFAAMVSAMDDGVGAILSTLKRLDLWHDTMVVFLSDNGCATYTNACSNDPLEGGKLTHWEGGQRVPFMVQYPAVLPAGATYDQMVSALDLLPTAMTLAGAPAPGGLDGVDLVPYLSGQRTTAPHENLFWRNGTNLAVRHGRWKYVNLNRGRHELLYDVATDVEEEHDLAAAKPDTLARLRALLAEWESEMVEPAWSSRRQIPIQHDGLEFSIFI